MGERTLLKSAGRVEKILAAERGEGSNFWFLVEFTKNPRDDTVTTNDSPSSVVTSK